MAPIKSSLAKTVGKLLGVQKDTDLSLRGATQSSRVPKFSASGGTQHYLGNGYRYHVFDYPNSDNFIVSSGEKTIEVLVVADGS